jgi:hypothetical protein
MFLGSVSVRIRGSQAAKRAVSAAVSAKTTRGCRVDHFGSHCGVRIALIDRSRLSAAWRVGSSDSR